jgi:hypothetical protein
MVKWCDVVRGVLPFLSIIEDDHSFLGGRGERVTCKLLTTTTTTTAAAAAAAANFMSPEQ